MSLLSLRSEALKLASCIEQLSMRCASDEPLKAKRFRGLLEAILLTESAMDEIAKADSSPPLGEPVDDEGDFRDDETVDGICANCGVPVGGYLSSNGWKFRREMKHYYPDAIFKHRIDGIPTIRLRSSRVLLGAMWIVCSEECGAILERNARFDHERRMTEWLALKQAKEMLNEARAWLRTRPEASRCSNGE